MESSRRNYQLFLTTLIKVPDEIDANQRLLLEQNIQTAAHDFNFQPLINTIQSLEGIYGGTTIIDLYRSILLKCANADRNSIYAEAGGIVDNTILARANKIVKYMEYLIHTDDDRSFWPWGTRDPPFNLFRQWLLDNNIITEQTAYQYTNNFAGGLKLLGYDSTKGKNRNTNFLGRSRQP